MNFKKLVEAIKKKVVYRDKKRVVKKTSDKSGYKMVDGKEVKMSPTEIRKRSKGQKVGARKRKATSASSSRKRAQTNKVRK